MEHNEFCKRIEKLKEKAKKLGAIGFHSFDNALSAEDELKELEYALSSAEKRLKKYKFLQQKYKE